MEAIRQPESVTRGRRPRARRLVTEPETLYGARAGTLLTPPRRSAEPAATGWFEVAAGRTLRFGPFDFDVLVFPDGSAAVAPTGGAAEIVDPNLAVLCRRGTTCTWTAAAGARCGLLTPGALLDVAPLGALAGALDRSARDPLTLWTFPAPVYLAQKLITADGPWRRPAPIPRPPEGPVASPRWRRVGGWSSDGRRLGGASTLVRRLREHLARELGEAERLSEVAERLGYSEGHLSRSFKEELGVTIHGYRHELRMRSAVDLLPFRSGELSDLALELGYASHSHFTARFFRTFGLTPSACRNLLLGHVRGGCRSSDLAPRAVFPSGPSPRPWSSR